jgi:Domain of unknown function (DUF4123)
MNYFELNDVLFDDYAYALIDPLAVDEAVWGHLPIESLAPEGWANEPTWFPYLVPLRLLAVPEREEVFGLLAERLGAGEPPLFCALLKSDAGTDTLVHHLSRATLVRPLNEPTPQKLRYHDPRVLIHLAWILDTAQQAAWLGPISAWAAPYGERWFQLSPPAITETATRWKREQWRQIRRIGKFNTALTRYRGPDDEVAVLSMRIDALLQASDDAGLVDEEDALAFVLHGLNSHPDFYHHPALARLLKPCAGQPGRYRRRSRRLTAGDWQAIASAMHERQRQIAAQGRYR